MKSRLETSLFLKAMGALVLSVVALSLLVGAQPVASAQTVNTYNIYKARIVFYTTAPTATLNMYGMFIYNATTTTKTSSSWTALSYTFSLTSLTATNVAVDVMVSIASNSTAVSFAMKEKSGWSKITFYNANGATPVKVYALNDTKLGTYFFSLPSASLLTASSPALTVSDTFRGSVGKSIDAFFYGWYTLSDWYNGRNGSSKSSVTGVPTLGFYDSSSLTVIDNQITLAKSAGVTGFIASWPVADSFTRSVDISLIKQSAALGFKTTLYYSGKGLLALGPTKARTQFVNDIVNVVGTYGSTAGFMKVKGVPVVFVFYADAFPTSWWKTTLAEARKSVPSVYFVADSSNSSYFDAFNGLSGYNINFGLTVSGRGRTNGTLTNFYALEMEANLRNKLWYAPTMPAFDNVNDALEPLVYFPRNNTYTYSVSWSLAQASNPDGITIATWNEWHEGTNIEPASTSPDYWSSANQFLSLTSSLVTQYLTA